MIEDKDDLEKNVDNKDYFKDEAFVKRWHKRNKGDAARTAIRTSLLME